MTAPLLAVEGLAKRFRLHLQGGAEIDVFRDLSFAVAPGEVVAVSGPSGMGKSSLLKLIYGTYRADAGAIRVRAGDAVVDVATAPPREIVALRRETLGYVTQFLRVIPRVPALDVVAEPLIERDVAPEAARARAAELLRALGVPERLWALSPVTFSGGEQQRINIARGFAARYPLMLLDEPTASLDAANRERVLALVAQAREAGTAMLCIFHDQEERARVATREIDLAAGRAGDPPAE
jgi:alpha-D-ribose 1-methylphosphonate 5-triphosphate synthase subunit PhnL